MIVFDLMCGQQHRFEGWFRSSEDFERQQASGMLGCPQCQSSAVIKAPMSPAVPTKRNRLAGSRKEPQAASKSPDKHEGHTPVTLPAEVAEAFAKLAAAQAKALSGSTWVGNAFAERSRAIHYGDAVQEQIHGRASPEEAAALVEEGIVIAPLLIPIVPPEEAN